MDTTAISGYGLDTRSLVDRLTDAKIDEAGKQPLLDKDVQALGASLKEVLFDRTGNFQDNWEWDKRGDVLSKVYPNRPLSVYFDPCNITEYYLIFPDVSVFSSNKEHFSNEEEADRALAQDLIVDYAASKSLLADPDKEVDSDEIIKFAHTHKELEDKLATLFTRESLPDYVSAYDLC